MVGGSGWRRQRLVGQTDGMAGVVVVHERIGSVVLVERRHSTWHVFVGLSCGRHTVGDRKLVVAFGSPFEVVGLMA